MERCGFFDAYLEGDEYDRVYLAQHFAAYFASFIANGVYAEHSNQLQVMSMATPQMQVSVEKGQGWINGYWYENTDSLQLPVDIADGVLNRIDSVVLRLGFAERDNEIRSEQTISRCMDVISAKQNPSDAIHKLLEIIADFYGADRTFILEFNEEEKLVYNTLSNILNILGIDEVDKM